MTNEMIILNASLKLMEEGILKGSGVFGEIENADGSKTSVELPEEIHTFNCWKERGFSVKKGAKSEIRIQIWKHTTKMLRTDTDNAETNKMNQQINDQGGQSNMFMKVSAFFTAAQVEPIKAR